MTNLTIDIGNSSAKAALWIDGTLAGTALWGELSRADIAQLAASCGGAFDCTAVCSVAVDKNFIAKEANMLSRKYIHVDSLTPTPIGLSAYATPRTLGADRIAALVGAKALVGDAEALVVDCGTAITYDRLSADGQFLGGNIAPGLGMRLRALHHFTARLPEADTNIGAPMWGYSTETAMQAGAIGGAIAEIEYYARQCPEGTKVVLTGGRARDLQPRLSIDTIYDPDLVLRGLNAIIEYNENI